MLGVSLLFVTPTFGKIRMVDGVLFVSQNGNAVWLGRDMPLPLGIGRNVARTLIASFHPISSEAFGHNNFGLSNSFIIPGFRSGEIIGEIMGQWSVLSK